MPVLRPGIVPLRPLSLGEIYDGAFQALRTNPKTMLGVTAVVVTLLTVLDSVISVVSARSLGSLVTDPDAFTGDDLGEVFTALGSFGTGAMISLVLQTLGIAVITGLLTVAVSQAVLGRRLPVGDLWQRTRRRVPALIGLTLLIGIITSVAAVLPLVPGIALLFVEPVVGGGLLVVGFLGTIAVYLFLYAKLALATPTLLLEDASVTTAIQRSWQLTKGSFWRVLGILLLTFLITFITVAIVAAPFSIGAGFLAALSPEDPMAALSLSPPQLLLTGIGNVIASTIVYPFLAAVVALLYVDLRMRREGLDVQLARAAQSRDA